MLKKRGPCTGALALLLAFLLVAPQGVMSQADGQQTFKQEELDQILAPIALYPDELLAQIFMAATYPLEVVQAARWVKTNPNLKGDQLTAAMEQQTWDPSVKSLVNFPSVLQMMNEKLDWTQKLGDAFLAQQKQVLDTVQGLRKKAQAQGNLKTTAEQKVVVEPQTQTIVIEPANPQVVYVPTYNPTVVYGAWAYPSYPPYYYYPPGYVAGAAVFSFAAGVAIGAAWGYAWGGCNWGHGNVDIDVNRNTNINRNIDRSKYQNKVTAGQGGRGEWKHNPESRKGVSYRDQATAQKFDRGSSGNTQAREQFRGRADAGRQDLDRGGASGDRGQGFDRQGGGQARDTSAFQNMDRGNEARDSSSRGRQSMASERQTGGFDRGGAGASRGDGGMSRGAGGGMSRGGGGGGRGGGGGGRR